ncbi:hypothetical protein [Weissella bombi]|uniref:hypothetical protein n=1 Tax=Weissella bombi TaxID=1505725 RepID=UPI003AF27AA5
MVYLEERVHDLEKHSKHQDEIINKLLQMVSNDNQKGLLSMRDAYIKLTGNTTAKQPSVSQYMNNLVHKGLIHKVLISGRPKFDPKELDELIESRKVTGRVI